MSEVKQASRKELTATEIADVVDDGGRVIIELSVLGRATDVVVRKRNGTYYCDTAIKLLTHDNRDDLQRCLKRFRLARRENVEEAESASVTT